MFQRPLSPLWCSVICITCCFFNGLDVRLASEQNGSPGSMVNGLPYMTDSSGELSEPGSGKQEAIKNSEGIVPTIYLPLVMKNYKPALLPVRGLFVQFERRGWASGYISGQLIHLFNTFDSVVGQSVSEEVASQLERMKQMGVNTIVFELRASDPTYIPGPFVPPYCNTNPDLGFQYPQPTQTELDNLVSFFNLVQGKGMHILLMLVNTHMEEQPPTNNQQWLGAILNTIKDHPALDLVFFDGNAHLIDTNGDGINDACGIPAETPLWLGPTSVASVYAKWAISYAHTLGIPYRKLSAEAIIGDYYHFNQGPAGPDATDGHLWDPIFVLKGIFDDLSIPDDQRTYAISFYEHRKCTTAQHLPCTDTNPHAWALETVSNMLNTIGSHNGARVVAAELGLAVPAEKDWNTELALKSLVWIMHKHGIDGGCFWRWTNYTLWEEYDPALASPIKRRGSEYIYNPVKDLLERSYTAGQVNDSLLVPDTTPPVFASTSISPEVIQNGDAVEITANLGEPYLFVTVDLSELDTAKNDLVVLEDQGNGIYGREVVISSWNEANNGIKNLQIKAMDFWSNVATAPIDAELGNPPPILDLVPPDDTFDGSTLDESKWEIESFGGGTINQDDRLIVATNGSQAYSSARVRSTWVFPGDFDAQAEFEIGEGWSRPATNNLGVNFGVIVDGEPYHITRVIRDNGDEVMLAWSPTGALFGEAATTATTGKLRVTRTGTLLTLLFDTGNGWINLAHTVVPLSPSTMYMGNVSAYASQSFTAYFDNFHINSGHTTWTP